MKVEKFKLVDDGYNGIHVWGKDAKTKENALIYVDAFLKFKVPIPKDITEKVQRLKLFFLQLTGYWENRYAAYLDEHYNVKDLNDSTDGYLRAVWLFESTTITGLTVLDGGYVITGKIRTQYDMTIGLASPKVTFDSNYHSYDQMSSVALGVVEEIEKYVNDRTIRFMEPKQFALEFYKDATEHDLEAVEHMEKSELIEFQRRNLSAAGYIVFNQDDLEDHKEEEKQAIHVGTQSKPGEDVDGDVKLPIVETGTEIRKKIVEEKKGIKPIKEKTVKPKAKKDF